MGGKKSSVFNTLVTPGLRKIPRYSYAKKKKKKRNSKCPSKTVQIELQSGLGKYVDATDINYTMGNTCIYKKMKAFDV